MTSLPNPPAMRSEPPRPRTSSTPSSPASLSRSSVPESRPPLLGQPGTSFVIKSAAGAEAPGAEALLAKSMVRVPSHRSECVCSCGASERPPEQPTTRRTAHPIKKAPMTALRYPWRTTAHCPLYVSSATSSTEHATQRSSAHLYGGSLVLRPSRGVLRNPSRRQHAPPRVIVNLTTL